MIDWYCTERGIDYNRSSWLTATCLLRLAFKNSAPMWLVLVFRGGPRNAW